MTLKEPLISTDATEGEEIEKAIDALDPNLNKEDAIWQGKKSWDKAIDREVLVANVFIRSPMSAGVLKDIVA